MPTKMISYVSGGKIVEGDRLSCNRRRNCDTCGTEFVPTREWFYKIQSFGTHYFCSYTCWRAGQKRYEAQKREAHKKAIANMGRKRKKKEQNDGVSEALQRQNAAVQ